MTMNNLRDKDTDSTADLDSLSFFSADPYFSFVYKKSERLCMAIYLITDFFPANDSIKDNLRKSGTELLKISLSLITATSSYRKNILNDISRICLEVVSLSKIAATTGMTSMPNHNVLEGEIKNFIGVIEERERPSTTGQGFILNEEVLGGRIESFSTPHVSPVQNTAPQVSQTHANEQKSYYHVVEKTGVKVNSPTAVVEKKTVESVRAEGHTKTEGSQGVTKPESVVKSVMQKNDRQQLILEIIREIGESSIKDISDNIKDCSEKTIQRELNTLIYDGVLKKIGERRWSKYVIA
jgi:hypothetical protein